MSRSRRGDPLFWMTGVLGLVAMVGWYAEELVLSMAGLTGVAFGLLIRVWSRRCLDGVSYRRLPMVKRASFGESLDMTVELRNEKLLPLTWLHVEDQVPYLTITGGEVNDMGAVPVLTHLLPMKPYRMVRRRLTVVCDKRGVHQFGPAYLRSGDPVGYGEKVVRADERHDLLVFPKVFALAPYGVVSRVPLGAAKAARLLMEDPSRPVGVREYVPGDPLRSVDWRATARSRSMMVKVCEPSASLRAAVFLDTNVPQLRYSLVEPSELEFTISVAASVLSDLAGWGVSVGLFSTGTVAGYPIARVPAPETLPGCLELLARASPFGPVPMGDLLLRESPALPHGTSLVVVAAHFPVSTLVALSELRRRRVSVTGVFVVTDDAVDGDGEPVRTPAPGMFDSLLLVSHSHDWTTKAGLELV